MSYLALYRKYRSKTFEEIVGQKHITQSLINQIKNGQVGHAYLFTGTRGTGKTSIAKIRRPMAVLVANVMSVRRWEIILM